MAPIVPTLRYERSLWRDGLERVVGVDEVGVAPTCGAVVAAAVIMKPNCHRIPGVRDSKTLSAAQRERLAPLIRGRAVAVGVGAASVTEIDRLNIYHATHLAMRRAIARVGEHEHVLVDGNRIANFEAAGRAVQRHRQGRREGLFDRLRVGGREGRPRPDDDACSPARYPGYGWERNQGYATLEHRMAIRELGLTPFHRRSFLALQRTLAGDQLGLFDDPEALSDDLTDDLSPISSRSCSTRRSTSSAPPREARRPSSIAIPVMTTSWPSSSPAGRWTCRPSRPSTATPRSRTRRRTPARPWSSRA